VKSRVLANDALYHKRIKSLLSIKQTRAQVADGLEASAKHLEAPRHSHPLSDFQRDFFTKFSGFPSARTPSHLSIALGGWFDNIFHKFTAEYMVKCVASEAERLANERLAFLEKRTESLVKEGMTSGAAAVAALKEANEILAVAGISDTLSTIEIEVLDAERRFHEGQVPKLRSGGGGGAKRASRRSRREGDMSAVAAGVAAADRAAEEDVAAEVAAAAATSTGSSTGKKRSRGEVTSGDKLTVPRLQFFFA
jgi:hypothetical protein